MARTTAAFLRDFKEPRSLGWTVRASWPFGWVTCCRHFVIAHLMAHWLGFACGRLWLSVSEDRLLVLDGDDARTPWGSAPLRCKLVRLCTGIASRTHWSLHPGASRVDGSGRVFAFLFKAGLSTSTSKLQTTTRQWKGRTALEVGFSTKVEILVGIVLMSPHFVKSTWGRRLRRDNNVHEEVLGRPSKHYRCALGVGPRVRPSKHYRCAFGFWTSGSSAG